MFEVYKPSGGFGISTFFYLPIGLVAAALLAIAYAYGLRYIPLIYISIVMSVAFGIGIGMLGSMVVDRGHCRNRLLAVLIGLLLSLFAVTTKHYVQYRLWVSDIAQAEVDLALRDPKFNRAELEKFREEIPSIVMDNVSFFGHFKVRAGEVMAAGSYSIWAIELGIVLLFGLMLSVDSAKEPYSEKLGMWASETEEAMYLPISSHEMVEQISSATTVEELLEIPIPKSLDHQRSALYEIHSVPGEELEDAYLSVKLVVKTIDKSGSETTEETKLVENAILTSSQRVRLLENASLLAEALEDYRQAMIDDAVEEEGEI